jgi:hypothetical protein
MTGRTRYGELAADPNPYLRGNDYKAEIQARGDTRARKAAHGKKAIHAE